MPGTQTGSPFNATRPLYANVIVPRHIAKAFTYLVPSALKETIGVGRRVLVPFGRTTLEAAVVSLTDHLPAGVNIHTLREIHSLSSEQGNAAAALFHLSRRIADHYVAPWGQCLRLIFHAGPKRNVPPARIIATEEGRAALKTGICPEQLRPLLKRIARRTSGVLSSTLRQHSPSDRRNITVLEKKSWVNVVDAKVRESDGKSPRRRSAEEPVQPQDLVDHVMLTRDLPEADPVLVDRITARIHGNKSTRMVIHAPWQSRMSVLACAIRQAHSIGKSVIIISGEIARAEWIRQLLSNMTKLSIEAPSSHVVLAQSQEGTASFIVGPRSAVFSQVKALGLIWVEEEDDPALKEPKEPRYHAREVAIMRGEIEGATVVLASSHPSLESKSDAVAEQYSTGHDAGSPMIELIDLRQTPGVTPFSRELIAAMEHAVARKTGVLLFLNRKGYAGALVCRECGWIPRCPTCAVAFPYSRETSALVCRYCGATQMLPDSCPVCRASRLSPVGEGTERIEVEARRLLPGARIARFDGATLRRPTAARALWKSIRSGRFDIVIGTQAVFQREPLPSMGLVGIVHADSGLHLPDFRAAERTYQLLVDAVSVARSASEGGRVILQTWLPTHHAITSVVSGEPSRFYDEELSARQLLGYPPARYLISLSVSGKDRGMVERAARQWRAHLEQVVAGEGPVVMLGPVPSMAGRPRGLHRDHMLLKGNDRPLLCRAVQDTVARLETEYRRGHMKFTVDVDPLEMA